MIDNGQSCTDAVRYVREQNVRAIDLHFVTHYDNDHNSCLDNIVESGVEVGKCYDRGSSRDTSAFEDYLEVCAGKRQTPLKGAAISVGGGAQIHVIDLNGAGVDTDAENSLGLVLKLSYAGFTHEFAGDIPGDETNGDDIESIVGPGIGKVDICKVHHHGSKFSSNQAWLDATDPEVCILSVGSNGHGHPALEALTRLRDHGVKLYWTNTGSGAPPLLSDSVVGTVRIAVSQGGSYVITGAGDQ